mmetsp:Transcript_30632/g.59735  ORF Transcript_30632/g.59735 Transcript_30632/m.59735 type:complete len:837 (-) Transcript_30632:47-2557(-)
MFPRFFKLMGLCRTYYLNITTHHSMVAFSNHLSLIVALVAILKYCILVAEGDYFGWTTPIIIASVVCKVLNTSSSSHHDDHSWMKTTKVILPTFLNIRSFLGQTYFLRKINSFFKSVKCIVINDCHSNAVFLSTAFIFTPCTIFFSHQVIRHLSSNKHGDHEGHDESSHLEGSHLVFFRRLFGRLTSEDHEPTDDRGFIHRELANDFGKLGAAALSFLLLPVLKHPSIFQALRLSEIHIIRLHIYAGSLAIFGGMVHGLYYIWIWIKLEKYSIDDVIPMATCWEDLYSRDYDKSCYSKFINSLGIIGCSSFIMLGIASLWWVRRRFYRVFYFIHVTLSVLILFCLAMHYNKMIYYLAPSLLTYMASNMPILFESMYKSWWQRGAQISKVVFIPDSGGCVEISLQLNDHSGGKDIGIVDSVGKYIRLTVPQISCKSHPFSIFSSPSDPENIKMLVRPRGEFTYHLSKICEGLVTSPDRTPSEKVLGLAEHKQQIAVPKILVNGIGLSSNQFEHIMKNDAIVIFAGGVGIVSYISLILMLQATAISKSTGGFEDKANNFSANKVFRTRQIHIHWMSRDEGLINHILHTYFQNTRNKKSLSDINFVIHHTNGLENSSVSNGISNYFTSKPHNHLESCAPLSSYYDGNKSSIMKNIMPAATQSIITFGGMEIIDYCYDNLQDKHSAFETRNVAVLGVTILAVVASAVSLAIIKVCGMLSSRVSYDRLGGDENTIEFAEVSRETSLDVESLDDGRVHSALDNVVKKPTVCDTMKISHSTGRPQFSEILSGVVDDMTGDNIGLFLCGPTSLTESVTRAADEVREKKVAKTYWEYTYREVFEW